MRIYSTENPLALGQAAAQEAAQLLNQSIERAGRARLVVSTGASQFETLEALVSLSVDWKRVTMFHLDEYLGISQSHPASFRRYLRERLLDHVDMGETYLIEGDRKDPTSLLLELTTVIREQPIDVGLIGIGENAHIAFNDPPADFSTTQAYRIVTLDEACRRQQVGEGWFDSIEDVPSQAISMTVYQILECRAVISSVPHKRKAEAVRKMLTSEETPWVPATALKKHPRWSLYLDRDSSSALNDVPVEIVRL